MSKKPTAEELHKEELVNVCLVSGLGDEEFLSGLDTKNLETMATSVMIKDDELETAKEKLAEAPKKSNGDDYSNSTTVNDLVKNKRIGVAETDREKK